LLVTLAVHTAGSVPPEDPSYLMGGDVRFIPLGIPRAIGSVALPVLAIADAAVLLVAGFLLGRGGHAKSLLPTFLIAVTQALWFTVPMLLRGLGPPPAWLGANSYVLIAVGHAVQYLWITAYYARTSEAGARSHASFFLRTLLAGSALWLLPGLVFGPGALGRFPWDAGLSIVTAAVINLHHFVLDGVIWKLREPTVSKVLIDETAAAAAPPPPRSFLPALGVAALAASFLVVWEEEFGFRRAYAGANLERVKSAVARLTLLGRDGPKQRVALGMLLAKSGDDAGALREFERSRTLFPLAASWLAEALLHEKSGNRAAALEAWRAALTLDPRSATARERIAALEAAAR
jgi:hypothetical protein